MSTHNICFHGEIRKKYLLDTLSYLVFGLAPVSSDLICILIILFNPYDSAMKVSDLGFRKWVFSPEFHLSHDRESCYKQVFALYTYKTKTKKKTPRV